MSENPEQPKKLPRKKRKNLNINLKKRWRDIVKDVDKKEVPIAVLEHISVKLIDSTSVIIDIKKLLDNGEDPFEIEVMLDEKFEDLNEFIETIDFFIDIEKVANTVQPQTNSVLKDL